MEQKGNVQEFLKNIFSFKVCYICKTNKRINKTIRNKAWHHLLDLRLLRKQTVMKGSSGRGGGMVSE